MASWRKEYFIPPQRCDQCGRIYPEGSGTIEGRIELFTDGTKKLCVTCASSEGVLPHASER